MKLPCGLNWYMIKMVFQVICGDGEHTPQFDEQFRLIHADEKEWAVEKANIIGRLEQDEFVNEARQKVSYKFIAVEEVICLPAIDDNVTVYAQTQEPADPHEYLTVTQARAVRYAGHA